MLFPSRSGHAQFEELTWISISPDDSESRWDGLPFPDRGFHGPDHVAAAAQACAEVEALIARRAWTDGVRQQIAQKGHCIPHWGSCA